MQTTLENPPARLHALVSGLVQMVGFRMFVVRQAARLSLTGWVRNSEDGGVEVVAEGSRQNLEQLLRLLHRGPSSARVTRVEEEWGEATGEFRRFQIA